MNESLQPIDQQDTPKVSVADAEKKLMQRLNELGKYIREIVSETIESIEKWKQENRVSEVQLSDETTLRSFEELSDIELAVRSDAEVIITMHEAYGRQFSHSLDRPDARSRNSGEVGSAAFARFDTLKSRVEAELQALRNAKA